MEVFSFNIGYESNDGIILLEGNLELGVNSTEVEIEQNDNRVAAGLTGCNR